jgi:hypothetical protein
LGIGSIIQDARGMAHFLVRDTQHIEKILVPLFDANPLLTSKAFSYQKFKDCLKKLRAEGDRKQNIQSILNISKQEIKNDFISTAWQSKNSPMTKD